jgi:CBS domain-containing protein
MEVVMNVSRVLELKGRTVLTVQPHRTLSEVAKLLTEHKIGATVVSGSDGRITGIISERDIVRAIAINGAAALENSVSKHMTEKVITCEENALMSDLMEVMTAGKFRHLPVVKNGRLSGIISIGDVVKYRIDAMESEQSALRSYITMS